MRRGVEADAIAGASQDALQHGAGGALAIGAADQNHRASLALTKRRLDDAQAIQPEVDGPNVLALDERQPLVEGHCTARDALQQSHQRGEFVAQLAAVDDHVDGAFVQQELGPLKPVRQGLADCLLDHARPGKTDQGARFGDHHIADKGKTGGHTTHGRVGQQRDEGQLFLRQQSDGGRGLGHLHQGEQAFLHARAATGGNADEGRLLLEGGAHAANELLADHRTH